MGARISIKRHFPVSGHEHNFVSAGITGRCYEKEIGNFCVGYSKLSRITRFSHEARQRTVVFHLLAQILGTDHLIRSWVIDCLHYAFWSSENTQLKYWRELALHQKSTTLSNELPTFPTWS